MDHEKEPVPVVLLPWTKPDSASPPYQSKAAFADRYLHHLEQLDIDSPTRPINLTNIMGTVTDKNDKVPHIKDILKSGVNILRIPTCFSKLFQVERTLQNVKVAIEELSVEKCMVVTCAVAMETKGTQMRTGALARPSNLGLGDNNYSVQITKDSTVVITADVLYEMKGTHKRFYVDSPELCKRVLPDDIIFINGRNIQLKVVDKENDTVTCTVIRGGLLQDNQLVTVPGVTFNLPVIGEKDDYIIDLVVRDSVDILILSSVSHADAIREVRHKLGERAEKVLILAKIESFLGLEYMDEIISMSDGVLLDRTNLTASTGVDVTFLAQKMIAARCLKHGKPFLVAGHILETHSDYNDVTSGDMNDISSIVQLGADVVVLDATDEQHLTVDILKTVLRKVENAQWEKPLFDDLTSMACPPLDPAHSVVIACVTAALKCQAAAIIVVTCSGYSAKLVARYRPRCPILAVSTLSYVCKHLNVYKNIRPLHYLKNPQADWAKDVDCRIQFAIQHGMEFDIIKPGDPLVLINGWRKGAGFTNIMRVVYAPIN